MEENNIDELKEMRLQLETLKRSLKSVEVANKRLIHKVINQKASSLNKVVWVECLTYPFIIMVLIGFCVATESSLWIAWSFAIVGAVDVILDFYNIRLSPNTLASESLILIREKIQKQKKHRKIQNAIMLPLSILWVGWLYVEFVKTFQFTGSARLILWIILGLILLGTLLIVFWLIRKIDGTSDSILNEIDNGN